MWKRVSIHAPYHTYGPYNPDWTLLDSSHAKHSSQFTVQHPFSETWLRKQTARREPMINSCLYRHPSPAADR
jgi:hypothetical protein